MRIVLGTGNRHKVAEFRRLLSRARLDVAGLDEFPDALAVPEDGASLAENARRKACTQAKHLRDWVLADDTGLEVEALRGAPGVRSARWAGEQATATDNRQKLLAVLADVPLARRGARFVCELALADPAGELKATARGECRGRIAAAPTGDLTFGYDPLFEVVEYHRTFGQLGPAAKDVLSHRARAVQRLWPRLVDLASRTRDE